MKRVILIVILVLLSTPSFGSFTPIKQRALSQKVFNLISKQTGKAGYVFIDAKSGLGVQVNGTQEFPAASVAKVPVMAAIYNLAYRNKLDINNTKFRYEEKDRLGGSGVLQWMKPGMEYSVWNLTRLMIVLSDNVATKILVENIGMDRIDQYLLDNGFKVTRITDPTMLAEPPSKEVNLTTPYEMARLMVMIKRCDRFSPADQLDMLKFMRNQRYRWGIWRGVPPGVVVADKTGNLEGILNDAGIVYTKYGDYVLSIFTWGFKKQKEARLLINELSRITYEEYTGEKVDLVKPVRKVKLVKKHLNKKMRKKFIKRR